MIFTDEEDVQVMMITKRIKSHSLVALTLIPPRGESGRLVA